MFHRYCLALLTTVAMLAALPAAASAWTAGVNSSVNWLIVGGTASANDDITITDTGANIRVVNTLAGAVAQAGCVLVNTNTVDCAESGITDIQVSLGSGDDELTMVGGGWGTIAGDFSLFQGEDGNDTIASYTNLIADDKLNGGQGNDTLDGGPGNDLLIGGLGADSIEGGLGLDDLVSYASEGRAEDLQVSIGDGPNDGSLLDGPADARDNIGASVENIIAGTGDDVLVGNFASNEIDGHLGDDHIRGGGGNDELTGGSGEDTLLGQNGIDTLDGGSSDDVLNGGEDSDTLLGGTSEDLLSGGEGADTLDGGTSDDVLRGGESNDILDGGPDADVLNGGASSLTGDTVTYANRTSPVNVTLGAGGANDGGAEDGTAGARDTVWGNVENVTGGSAGDTLTGTELNNTFLPGAGPDVITGLAGVDTVSYFDHTAGVTVVIDGTPADGNASDGPAGARDLVKTDIENLIGTNFADSLKGSAAANRIDGRNGADSLFGLNGNDVLQALDGAADTVLNCGGGTLDILQWDGPGVDPAPTGCEDLQEL